MEMLRITHIINIIMIFTVTGCTTTQNIYQNRKTPSQNTQYLKENHTSQPKDTNKPITKTQYGYYGEPTNNKSFYNSLLKSPKISQPVLITDEVANNNISKIKQESLNKPDKIEKQKTFYLQIGAYSNHNNAAHMQNVMSQYGNTIIKKEENNKKTLNKVQIGPLNSLKKTLDLQQTLSKEGYSQTIVIKN